MIQINSNTTDPGIGAGTAYPSGHLIWQLVLVGLGLLNIYVFDVVFCIALCVPYLLTIV